MEKKTECEIVQDLLLGYVDNTLNHESKKIVEEHLSECENCVNRLQEIKKDIQEDEEIEQKEIDYLKKVRIKGKIKSIINAILIIFVLVVAFYTNKFIKISCVMNKGVKSLESQNYYSKSHQILSDGMVAVDEIYYKDGKYKIVNKIYSDNGIEMFGIIYGEVNKEEIIEVNEKSKTIYIRKGDVSKRRNIEENIKCSKFSKQDRKSISSNLGKAFIMSLDTDNNSTGKKCYILRKKADKNNDWEIWIDRKTGLVVKEIQRGAGKKFIDGTDIVKQIIDSIVEYQYEFDKVTDEDIKIPDFTGYKIETIDNNFYEI